ncbi:hypothetical protein L1281_002401 [Neisseria sp. HSC-16F19]|nr:phage tail tape measure protein [Neisseria sp. HSC-16F19]MCP2041785.1 hypothetical protein [Neisseria sp. HSC-16F19]
MSRNLIELVARFQDRASQGLRRLSTETQRAAQAQARSAAVSVRQQSAARAAYARIGIRSEREIQREIERTQRAYRHLAQSGVLSQRELARAAQATRGRIRELNNEMGRQSGAQRIAGLGRGLAAGAASVTAGGMVLARPVSRTMDYDTELRHAVNTLYAGKSLAEKRAGMAEVNQAVSDAAHLGGRSRSEALAAMNTMAASGAMSDEAVRSLLPTVMKTAAAANADGNEIATLVSKALQAGFRESDIPALLDRAVQSGVDGGFELRDMARWLPQQMAAMKNAGMAATLDNFSAILSANQLSFMTAGSADEAGNNLVNLLAKINSQDTITKAKKIKINGKEGFDFTASMTKRQAEGMNSLDAIVDIVRELVGKDEKSRALMAQLAAAQGDEAKMAILESQKALVDGTAVGQLVSDRQALMALLSLVNNAEAAERLREGQSKAEGAVQANYDFLAEGSGFRVAQAKATAESAEYAAFNEGAHKLGEAAEALTNWARGNPDGAATAVGGGYVGAAAAAAWGGWSVFGGKGLFGGLLGGSKGLAGGGVGGAAGGAGGGIAAGSLAAAAAPLAVMGGVTLWAGKKDKSAETSALRSVSHYLSNLLPDFGGDARRGELLRQRAELGGEHARNYENYLRAQGKNPLDSPELQQSMQQMQQSAQTYQQAGDQYAQAVSDNHQAAVQLTAAAGTMQTAAAQFQAAAGRPIPVTVTVQNGHIAAYINQAAARDNRRN